MNTIAWRIDGPEETFYLALNGDTALLAKRVDREDVWQFRGKLGQSEAIDRLIRETASIEQSRGVVGDPVEFNLSFAAMHQIRGYGEYMDWVYAPQLREELMAAVEMPIISGHMVWHGTTAPAHPAAPGDTHFDSSRGVVKVWTGTEWIPLGTVNAMTMGIEMTT